MRLQSSIESSRGGRHRDALRPRCPADNNCGLRDTERRLTIELARSSLRQTHLAKRSHEDHLIGRLLSGARSKHVY